MWPSLGRVGSNVNPRLSDKIIGNTLFSALGYAWDVLVIRLVLAPYILYRLDLRDFGVWAIISSLVGYFSFMGFSVDSGFVKYISEHYTKRDYLAINRVVNTGLLFYGVLGLAIVAAVHGLGAPILGIFVQAKGPEALPEGLTSLASFVGALRIASAAFFVLCLVRVFESVLDGLQRMGLTNGVRMAVGVPFAGLTVLFLEQGWGVKGLATRDLCVFVVEGLAAYAVAKWALPELRVNPFRYSDWPTFSRLFKFGIKMHVNTVCGIINYSVDKLFIGSLIDPGQLRGMVSSYEFGGKVNMMARMLPGVMGSAVVPAASELHARDDAEGLSYLATRGTRYLAMAAAPLMALVYVSAPHLLRAWVAGEPMPLAACTAQLLAVGYFFWCLSGGVSRVVLGMGRPGILLKMSVAALITNVGLSLVLLLLLGFPGAPLGTTIASVLSTLLLWRLFLREVGGTLWAFVRASIWAPMLAGVGACVAVSFGVSLIGVEVFPDRLSNLSVVALEAAALGPIYLTLLYLAGGIDKYDIDLAKRWTTRLYRFVRPARQEDPTS